MPPKPTTWGLDPTSSPEKIQRIRLHVRVESEDLLPLISSYGESLYPSQVGFILDEVYDIL